MTHKKTIIPDKKKQIIKTADMNCNFFLFNIILLFSILTSCNGQDKNSWIEDIDYFSEQLPKKHKDFYKLIDSVHFKLKIDSIKDKVDSSDDITLILELQKILASLKVSHTMIPIQNGKAIGSLPLMTEIFDDGLYIIGIDKTKKEYLSKRIISINNFPIEEIYNRLKPLISYENEYWLNRQIPKFLVKPKVLEFIGVINGENFISFQLDNEESFELSTQQLDREFEFIPIWTELIWLKNQNKFYWHDILPNNVLYIQYNKCQVDKSYPFDKFVDDVVEAINDNHIKTIFVDLRLNSGGNSEIIKPLIQKLQNYKDKNIYAAISKRTFSSGRFAARDMKVMLNAKLIGEPTGGSPKSYGENRSLILPNSKLPINYCVKYFSLIETDKNFFEPDIRIAYNAKDLFEGKDLVLEYVTNK
jgi:hypothetical protein